MTSNAVPPSVTPPSPNEYPSTIKTITGINNASRAKITCPLHGFTTADVGLTFVMPLQVKGMLPVNGVSGLIESIVDSNNFTVDINTNFFPIYRSGGVISVLTSQPPVEQQGFQVFNRPFQNIA